jgi:hypothetical protein
MNNWFDCEQRLLIKPIIVQRATVQSKTGLFRDNGEDDASPGFQAGWSDCIDIFLFLFILFADLNHEHCVR